VVDVIEDALGLAQNGLVILLHASQGTAPAWNAPDRSRYLPRLKQ
jgi:hypothetical protein